MEEKNYGLSLYEWQENIINPDILKGEEINYSVLIMIMNNKSRKVYTDHKRIIICHSWEGMPVWVWAKEDATDCELKNIIECLNEEFSLSEGYTYNISYELLDKLKQLDDGFKKAEIEMNMLSHRCDNVNEIESVCDGRARLADEKDVKVLCKLVYDFEYEAAGKALSEEEYKQRIQAMISDKTLYVWENAEGEIVSTTNIRMGDGMDTLALVYTKPEARRKGYALNLVHTVTKIIKDKGKLPILYTNADYIASNDCYKKVGYTVVGSLCTIKGGKTYE